MLSLTPNKLPWHYSRFLDSEIVTLAQAFKTRSEWERKDRGLYRYVLRRRRHLMEECKKGMGVAVDPFGRHYSLYVYQFQDGEAYVGITLNPKARHRRHIFEGPVSTKIRAGVLYELFEVVNLSRENAVAQEVEKIKELKAAGVPLLNIREGGQLGTLKFKYAFSDILERAKTCSGRGDFQKRDHRAYKVAYKRKWLARISTELGWKPKLKTWSKEAVFAEAGKHQSVRAWYKSSGSSVQAAIREGWYDEITSTLCMKRRKHHDTH